MTDQLIEHAGIIIEKRIHFLERLRNWAADIHSGISRNLEHLDIRYQATIDLANSDQKEEILQHYRSTFEKKWNPKKSNVGQP